ncbi:twin-arginine translocase subunit TatC [Sandaracinomonas limnophila]|uniref:Sec-independent protein translocase protein TatC n=1 Tax=Sandaracinomonas limnophila TaxID=1862386 RepID=A0A437PM38_9BACT|nr:twin-arginine translocase subunit TatC [Sandaracinomonas limnophila]RVU23343.1 twin-arginine translocase subunit TatC [Sandaracinomonas limnophila]
MALDQDWDENEEDKDGTEMSFFDHLEELRWHIIRSLASIVIFTVAAWIFREEIFGIVIMGPTKVDFYTNQVLCKIAAETGMTSLCMQKADFILQSREVSGQFMMALTQSIIVGLLFAFPYAFFEIWRFVTPGLKNKELKAARGAVFWVSLLFFIGVAFGYFIVAPMAINFLANFKLDPSIQNQFDINDYISLLSMLTLACGLTFQLPMIAYVLSQVGILTPSFMREYRKHALVVILIIAALITPSPDMISQLLVTIPLVGLYEISIIVSGRVLKRKMREELEDA